jgi:hypothetical protein
MDESDPSSNSAFEPRSKTKPEEAHGSNEHVDIDSMVSSLSSLSLKQEQKQKKPVHQPDADKKSQSKEPERVHKAVVDAREERRRAIIEDEDLTVDTGCLSHIILPVTSHMQTPWHLEP